MKIVGLLGILLLSLGLGCSRQSSHAPVTVTNSAQSISSPSSIYITSPTASAPASFRCPAAFSPWTLLLSSYPEREWRRVVASGPERPIWCTNQESSHF